METTTDAAGEFFASLGKRGHEPLLARATGTVRFDLVDGDRTEHWLVTIQKGDITVSRKRANADAVVCVDTELANGLCSGRVNATAAMLRGLFAPEGDLALMILFQRLFPAPQAAAK